MTREILTAYGQMWITKPDWWDDEHCPCESLIIPDEGTFIKLDVFVSELLEVPYKWIHDVRFNSDTRYLDIIFDKCALNTDQLTATIIMCDNRWGPCLVGLHSEYSDDEYGYETVYLKVSINV